MFCPGDLSNVCVCVYRCRIELHTHMYEKNPKSWLGNHQMMPVVRDYLTALFGVVLISSKYHTFILQEKNLFSLVGNRSTRKIDDKETEEAKTNL